MNMTLIDVQLCPSVVEAATSTSNTSSTSITSITHTNTSNSDCNFHHHNSSRGPQEQQLRRISLAAPYDSFVFQRKKRKLSSGAPMIASNTRTSASSSTNSSSQISMDFLSGIFQDLSEVTTNSDSDCSNNCIGNEKAKRCRAGSLTSVRSLASLQDAASAAVSASSSASGQESSSDELAAQIVDTVFASRVMPMFPDLPHTISASSCSSNNLTLTSVPAAQVTENPTNIMNVYTNITNTMLEAATLDDEHDNEEYGFYVDLDNDSIHQRFESVTKATETCRRSLLGLHDLAFSSSLHSKQEPVSDELDSDIAWAKAADTVDDVLGDLF